MDLGDIPEILIMVARYLGTNTLSCAVRVSRQWHRHLLPELWSWLQIFIYHTRVGVIGPQLLLAMSKYGHFIRVLSLTDIQSLDFFRQRPSNRQGNSVYFVNNLTELALLDEMDEDRDMIGEWGNSSEARRRLMGLMLIARAHYEKVDNTLNDLAVSRSNNTDVDKLANVVITSTHINDYDSSCYTWSMLPPIEDDEVFDDHWSRPVDRLINPPYFDPLMHLLQHNQRLCVLTVYHFPLLCSAGIPRE